MRFNLSSRLGRLVSFGGGLAEGAADARELWKALVRAFVAVPEENRDARVLIGFLRKLGDRAPNLAAELLDAAVDHEALGCWFPLLQCSVTIDETGVNRLRRSLALDLAPVAEFRNLAWGRSHESVSAKDLKELVTHIGEKPNGVNVGLEIVFFRLFGDQEKKRAHEPDMIEAGRDLLGKLEIGEGRTRNDHELGLIVARCLAEEAGVPVARALCERFKEAADKRGGQVQHYHEFFEGMCKAQPVIVLDTFFGGDEPKRRTSARMLRRFGEHQSNPLDSVADECVITWCDGDPDMRYGAMAAVVSYLSGSEGNASSRWSHIALKLLERAPDRVAVAKQFAERFRPPSWSGSLAPILEGRRVLLTELEQHPDPRVVEFAIAEGQRLATEIEAERKFETAHDRLTDERFE